VLPTGLGKSLCYAVLPFDDLLESNDSSINDFSILVFIFNSGFKGQE